MAQEGIRNIYLVDVYILGLSAWKWCFAQFERYAVKLIIMISNKLEGIKCCLVRSDMQS